MCHAIGEHGAALLKDGMGVLTHCNAGALATGDFGTALAPVYVAAERGVKVKVFSDETRPLLQGSRLTAWELHRAGVDVTTICDNMAAQVMREGKVQIVIVGADRVAANGDSANKIGTYGVAVLAKHHKIPFYVAMPYSTIDASLPDGSGIPIEQRAPRRSPAASDAAPPPRASRYTIRLST
jgi:methylthioribose-1-phosphate isomerase